MNESMAGMTHQSILPFPGRVVFLKCKSDHGVLSLKLAIVFGRVPNVLAWYSRPFKALENSSGTK